MLNMLVLDMPIGKRLQQCRKAKKLTQAEVVRAAHQLGSTISENTYAKIEQGIRNIQVSDFVILKMVLEFQYDDIFQEIEAEIREQAK